MRTAAAEEPPRLERQLPGMIAEACAGALAVASSGSPGPVAEVGWGRRVPVAYSPLVCGSDGDPRTAAAAAAVLPRRGPRSELRAVRASFAEGAVPKDMGENSRSGAEFFFSGDRRFIAKRVREKEAAALWSFTQNCNYQEQLRDGSSLLNPILLSFVANPSSSYRRFWIVLRVEGLPEKVQRQLPGRSWGFVQHRFFYDAKPPPMISEVDKLSELLGHAALVHDLHLATWAGAPEVWDRLRKDVKVLDDQNIVDYSLLMHGVVLEHRGPAKPTERYVERTVLNAVRDAGPNCIAGCSGRPKDFADVTEYLDENWSVSRGEAGSRGSTYRCCCLAPRRGDGEHLLSPCVLVDVGSSHRKRWFGRPDCHDFFPGLGDAMLHAPGQGSPVQRCLVARKAFEPGGEGFQDFSLGGIARPKFLPPESLVATPPPDSTTSCAVVCVAVSDYLLPYDTRNRVEDVALVLGYYWQRKWAAYADRFARLFACLLEMPLARSGALLPFLRTPRDHTLQEVDRDYCEGVVPQESSTWDTRARDDRVEPELQSSMDTSAH